jgi:hypothetical protein
MNTRLRAFSLAVLVSFSGVSHAAAQSLPSRLEVGVQASVLRLSDFDSTTAGVGGRVSFDLAPWMAIDAQANFFPNDDALLSSSGLIPDLGIVYRRTRADAFFGAKIGWRGDRFGVFAKARPGFTRLADQGVDCIADVCALALLARPEYRTEFAVDLGGVFELYPSARTVARFELGDTRIWHRSSAPPCWASTCSSHNLTSRFGVGLRF